MARRLRRPSRKTTTARAPAVRGPVESKHMIKLPSTESKISLPRPSVLIGWVALIGILFWSYICVPGTLIPGPQSVFGRLVRTWWSQPDYGHGFFVPVFAAALLWRRREMVTPLPDRGSWWGIAFFGLWAVMRSASAYFAVLKYDELSLLPLLAGVAVFVGGWRALRWAWQSIVFLVFMIPLPGGVQGWLSPLLQKIGTGASVYVIQTLGIPVVVVGEESNVIQLPQAQLGVVEACSGLRMLMLFFAISVGAAFWLRCPLWKKAVIVIGAIPIAVFSNVIRITVTAVLYEMANRWPSLISEKAAQWLFHDGAGLLMMPLGLVLLWGLWKLLEMLVVDSGPAGPLALGGALTRGPISRDSDSKTNS